jgi:hypothetical protein
MLRMSLGVHTTTKTDDRRGVGAGCNARTLRTKLPAWTGLITRAAMEGIDLGIDAAAIAEEGIRGAYTLPRLADLRACAGDTATATMRGIALGIDTTAKAARLGDAGTLEDTIAIIAGLGIRAALKASAAMLALLSDTHTATRAISCIWGTEAFTALTELSLLASRATSAAMQRIALGIHTAAKTGRGYARRTRRHTLTLCAELTARAGCTASPAMPVLSANIHAHARTLPKTFGALASSVMAALGS